MLTQTFGLDLDRSAEEQAAAVALLQQAEQHLLRYQSSSSTEPGKPAFQRQCMPRCSHPEEQAAAEALLKQAEPFSQPASCASRRQAWALVLVLVSCTPLEHPQGMGTCNNLDSL